MGMLSSSNSFFSSTCEGPGRARGHVDCGRVKDPGLLPSKIALPLLNAFGWKKQAKYLSVFQTENRLALYS
jgi:hypothetical protein